MKDKNENQVILRGRHYGGIDILNKNISFSKMEDRKVKQVLSGGWYQREGQGYKEGERGGDIMYSCMKIEK
jgi:hypothetical protein